MRALLLVLLLVLVGCESITDRDILEAQKICNLKGGLKEISVSVAALQVLVKCGDQTYFNIMGLRQGYSKQQ